MASQRNPKTARDAAGRFVAAKPRRPGPRRPTSNRLLRIAERMRERLEERLGSDDETLFTGRDNGVALLLRLTEVMERLAALEHPTNIPLPLDDDDRAILDRYFAWRLRVLGVDAGVEGVPPPDGAESQAQGEPLV